jgi:L-ascorbate metabolism protein UlaG (beta-lactamase superfamily)
VAERLTFLGHSTVLIDLDGVGLLTDPLLGHLVPWAIRRHVPAVIPGELAGLSAVFIRHSHLDHLDLASLGALPGRPTFFVPVDLERGVAAIVRGPVHEMRVGDRLRLGDLTLEAVHAEHGHRRSLFTTAEDALGLLLAGSTRVYFAGDTDLVPAMDDLSGPVDVALLPVSGWGPMLGPGHLDPVRAAEAAARIQPAIAIPIHWGTLFPLGLRRLARRRFEGPGEASREAVAARAPGVAVRILPPGNSVSLVGPPRP